jgi:hypothetical protein
VAYNRLVKLLLAPLLALSTLVACSDEGEVPPMDVSAIGAGRPFFDPEAAAAAAAAKAQEAAAAAEASAALNAGVHDAGLNGSVAALSEAGTASDDPVERYGWTRDRDGYIQISYLDLVLDGLDQELLVEKLLYPEDYEDLELDWPERVRALDGQKVALTGYMLPLLWKDTTVPHFMLVRDLMACCFGGAPKPDEWTDVKMDGEGAGYWSYVPVITRGIFRLAGIADEAGYAAGAYSIEGHDVRREL